ncbi:sulfite exporter TauE/SafE family protein [Dyadobacter tibetensis]|uniref:sulfite exporter TauE/SafE family protein n=1 Tax=Dyadobacter tibetensis TaxID=1211851 RepID=UPI00046FBE12|nr:sulfite exporter TauE/SafE family protein [Dyadobacter tibetensis]
MTSSLPFLALSMGLLSSFHCLGMCGPIALALPVYGGSSLRQIVGILTYNSGRALTYALLGMLMGSLAATITWIGYFRYLSIGAGILILLNVIYFSKMERLTMTPVMAQRLVSCIKISMGNMLRKKNPIGWFLLGSLNGLLPCGMVYLALVSSVATGGSFAGSLFMFWFGVGTMPMMIGIGFFKQYITPLVRARVKRLIPAMLAIAGLWLIIRGITIEYPKSQDGNLPVCHSPSDSIGEK